MSIFRAKHEHHWEIKGAQYEPRPDELLEAKGMSPDLMREVLYGATILTQQCEGCGWVSTSRVAGKPDLKKLGLSWPTEQKVT